MTRAEAGRLGGQKTYETHGIVRCKECGRLHDTGYMARLGSRGGSISGPTFRERYGADYYSRIGKLGGRPRRQASSEAVDMNGEGELTSRPPQRSVS